jgi:putative CocE/NonD family hydrolase
VPTLGGNHSGPQDHPEVIRVGALDQRPNWKREDVLVFVTPPLDEDVEVTGPIQLRLFAASSAPDTDFIGRLIDLPPDGPAYNITEGIIRARFRESVWEPPQLIEPGKVYEYAIDLQPTSNVFEKGHRICLHVTSSSFPMWDRNPNTGAEQGMDTRLEVAKQTIYHDAERASRIVLPVIAQ